MTLRDSSLKGGACRISLLGGLLLVSACSGSPSSSEAADAVRRLVASGGALVGLALPPSVGIKTVSVGQCMDAKPLDGHYCAVNVVSDEIPIVGALVVPITLRFVKRESNWVAFIN